MSNFKVFNVSLTFTTEGDLEFIDVTEKVREAVSNSCIKNGIVHVFAPHATGILILTENEHNLLQDVRALIEDLVPKRGTYVHPTNAYAHLRSVALPPDKTLPLINGQIALGTWQSLLFVETDVHPRRRTLIVQVLGTD
jgi:secondary thiamine-phosphate synthase enzyme